jgi:hypothetical protein
MSGDVAVIIALWDEAVDMSIELACRTNVYVNDQQQLIIAIEVFRHLLAKSRKTGDKEQSLNTTEASQ